MLQFLIPSIYSRLETFYQEAFFKVYLKSFNSKLYNLNNYYGKNRFEPMNIFKCCCLASSALNTQPSYRKFKVTIMQKSGYLSL
jgi:hypothetical protein